LWEWHEPGERLEGVVLALGEFPNTRDDGQPYPAITIAREERRLLVLSRSVLFDRVRELEPGPGDRLTVEYVSKGDQAMLFRAEVERARRSGYDQ
jgi:hypothetical protein